MLENIFHKSGKFSITRYLLIIWMHLVFIKFAMAGLTVHGSTGNLELPKGWIEFSQVVALLYIGTHNFSFHGGSAISNLVGKTGAAVVADLLGKVEDSNEQNIRNSKDLDC